MTKRHPRPPLWLVAVLAAGMLVDVFGDFYASACVTATSAQAGGPILRATAPAGGVLAAVLAGEGATVKAGELVARLVDHEARSAVLQAEAGLAAARAGLAGARATHARLGAQAVADVGQGAAGVSAARAAVAAAGAAVGLSRSELARLRALDANGLVSRQALEAAGVAITTATAERSVAASAEFFTLARKRMTLRMPTAPTARLMLSPTTMSTSAMMQASRICDCAMSGS